MQGFTAETFGDLNAADYDATQDPGTTDQTVDFLYDLTGDSRVLELAIGTGRIALPLAAKGAQVSGIEASDKMVALMREKPGGADIPVVIGDMADVGIDGPFDHAFLVFNTLFNLSSQAAQISCFQNLARVLAPGGTFTVEAFVPRFDHFTNHQAVQTRKLTMDTLWLEAVAHDPVLQTLAFQRVRITDEGMRLVPFFMRYAHPPEIDLMAQLAGLRLRARWGGWDRSAFHSDSRMHVSMYEKT